MSARYFVDTSILIYAHDSSAGKKHDRAKALIEELWRSGSGVVSTQILQELCLSLRRKANRPVDLRTVREIVTDYLSWKVHVNTGESILEALGLEERYRVSFWDALVIQAAEASGARGSSKHRSTRAQTVLQHRRDVFRRLLPIISMMRVTDARE